MDHDGKFDIIAGAIVLKSFKKILSFQDLFVSCFPFKEPSSYRVLNGLEGLMLNWDTIAEAQVRHKEGRDEEHSDEDEEKCLKEGGLWGLFSTVTLERGRVQTWRWHFWFGP